MISDLVNNIINLINPKSDELKKISLHEPFFKDTNVKTYLNDCVDTGWVSSAGKWVDKFEKEICNFTGSANAVAVSNGTVGLRLGLHLLGVRPNEEVLLPPLTFVATANAISHLGAVPHFIDIERESFGLDPQALFERLNYLSERNGENIYNKLTGRRIAAIVPVHVFGHPANCEKIKEISDFYGIPVLEDASEALGSYRNQVHCGLFGEIGVLSFNGNKLITTGGGGALITNNKNIADKARHLSTTAKMPHPWEFDHDEIGWNDRLPNINAALGVAQFEVLRNRLNLKRKLAQKYKSLFKKFDYVDFINEPEGTSSNFWLSSIIFNDESQEIAMNQVNDFLDASNKKGLLIRPAWKLLSNLDIYRNCPKGNLEKANLLQPRIVNLPSSAQILMKNF